MSATFTDIHSPSVLAIDSYNSKRLQGRFYHPHFGKELAFNNVMQFLLLQEQLLDEAGGPQSFTERRSFWQQVGQDPLAGKNVAEQDEVIAPGARATFNIKVIFRKNASWQGTLTWVDKSQEESFRSVLEMLLLLDNALSV